MVSFSTSCASCGVYKPQMLSSAPGCYWHLLVPLTDSQSGWGRKGGSGGQLVQPPAQAGPPRATSRRLLNISKDGESTTSLGNLCQCLVTSHSQKVFPDVQREPPVFQFVPIASCPVTGYHWKGLALSSSHPPFRYLYTFMRSPPEPSPG